MKGKYKRKEIWCSKCDANLVSVGSKCSNCGSREYGSKIKKNTVMRGIKEMEVIPAGNSKKEIERGDQILWDIQG